MTKPINMTKPRNTTRHDILCLIVFHPVALRSIICASVCSIVSHCVSLCFYDRVSLCFVDSVALCAIVSHCVASCFIVFISSQYIITNVASRHTSQTHRLPCPFDLSQNCPFGHLPPSRWDELFLGMAKTWGWVAKVQHWLFYNSFDKEHTSFGSSGLYSSVQARPSLFLLQSC